MDAATPEKRDARPSAFSKLFYFMRPDKGKMALSLMMACIGETLGMVLPPRLPARQRSSFSPGAPR